MSTSTKSALLHAVALAVMIAITLLMLALQGCAGRHAIDSRKIEGPLRRQIAWARYGLTQDSTDFADALHISGVPQDSLASFEREVLLQDGEVLNFVLEAAQ